MAEILTAEERAREHQPRVVLRHTFGIRVMHWWTAVTFIYLLLSGFALGYPRMAWLLDLMGGGQSVRFLHPWVGLGFVVGFGFMLVLWLRQMTFQSEDREWFRQLGKYVRTGHTDTDTDKWNGGQKSYYWFTIVNGFLLAAHRHSPLVPRPAAAAAEPHIPIRTPWSVPAGSRFLCRPRLPLHGRLSRHLPFDDLGNS